MGEPWELDWARLPLESVCNARELGGYPASDGLQTRYHRFVRSGALSSLSDADARFLHGYGVRAVLDLRGAAEAAAAPDRPIGPDVIWENIPLLDFNLADDEQAERWDSDPDYPAEDVYRTIVGNREAVARCMRFIADAPEGCVLFHCAVGKDRTGMIAYLLMAIAGCDRWDCLSSYMVSRVNLMREAWFIEEWERDMSYTRRGHYDSRVELMGFAIDLIQNEFGGVRSYLRGCGVSDAELARLRARML